jgi:hypothetical protein
MACSEGDEIMGSNKALHSASNGHHAGKRPHYDERSWRSENSFNTSCGTTPQRGTLACAKSRKEHHQK